MKTKRYNIITLLIGLVLFTSCEKNDLIDDVARPGHLSHNVYWEVGTPNVVAGSNVAFNVQYWGMNKETKYLGVWYDIKRNLKYSLSYGGTVYTFTYDSIGSVRDFQEIKAFEHNPESYSAEKKAYYFEGDFPTSYTLSSLTMQGNSTFSLSETLLNQLVPKYIQDMFYKELYDNLEFEQIKKILTDIDLPSTDSVLLSLDDFNLHVDTVFIEDPEATEPVFELIIKEESLPLLYSDYFTKMPLPILIYDTPSQTYKIDYSSVYELGARFKVVNGTNTENFSDVVKIDLQ